MKHWNTSISSAPFRIWSLHSDMGKNAALRDASGKRVIKALSAKSKPTSNSFEIKPLKYQRIPGETQGCLSDCTAGRGERHSCRDFTGYVQYEWFWLNTHSYTQARTTTAHTMCWGPHHVACLKLTQFLIESPFCMKQAPCPARCRLPFYDELMRMWVLFLLFSSGCNLNPINPLTFSQPPTLLFSASSRIIFLSLFNFTSRFDV